MGKIFTLQEFMKGAQAQVPDADLRKPIQSTWSNWCLGIHSGITNTLRAVVGSPSLLLDLPQLLVAQIRTATFLHEAVSSISVPDEIAAMTFPDRLADDVSELSMYYDHIEGAYNRALTIQTAIAEYNSQRNPKKTPRCRQLVWVAGQAESDLFNIVSEMEDTHYHWGPEWDRAHKALEGFFMSMANQSYDVVVKAWSTMGMFAIYTTSDPEKNLTWGIPCAVLPIEQFRGLSDQRFANLLCELLEKVSRVHLEYEEEREIYEKSTS